MSYLKEAIHMVYLMKQLQVIGKSDVIGNWTDEPIAVDGDIDYDTIYSTSLSAISGIFEYYNDQYNDDKGVETTVLSDKVIVDYYLLAGIYGKRNGLTNKNNPYFQAAEKEASSWFYFSYSLGWRLAGYTDPKKPFKSKLVILMSCDGDVDIIGVAIGVAGMYQFFSEKCDELRELLSSNSEKKSSTTCAEFSGRNFSEKEAAAA